MYDSAGREVASSGNLDCAETKRSTEIVQGTGRVHCLRASGTVRRTGSYYVCSRTSDLLADAAMGGGNRYVLFRRNAANDQEQGRLADRAPPRAARHPVKTTEAWPISARSCCRTGRGDRRRARPRPSKFLAAIPIDHRPQHRLLRSPRRPGSASTGPASRRRSRRGGPRRPTRRPPSSTPPPSRGARNCCGGSISRRKEPRRWSKCAANCSRR